VPAANTCKVAQVYAGSTSDKGWSWAHEQSLLAAQQELPGADLSIRRENVSEDDKQAAEDLIESMARQGANVIYTTSAGFAEPTRAVAVRHPEIAFYNAAGIPGPKDPPNMSYYNATIEEGRYIAGELAGLVVEPGSNIGYVASQPTPEGVPRRERVRAGGDEDQSDRQDLQQVDIVALRRQRGEAGGPIAAGSTHQGVIAQPAAGLVGYPAGCTGRGQVRHGVRL
jgi:hypothetical protein